MFILVQAIVLFFIAAILALPILFIFKGPKCVFSSTKITGVVSLKDSSKLEGNFILGTGSIGTDSTYFFYEQKNGGYTLNNLSTQYTMIYEDTATGSAYLVDRCDRHLRDSGKYELHVPKGTILRQFSLDSNI